MAVPPLRMQPQQEDGRSHRFLDNALLNDHMLASRGIVMFIPSRERVNARTGALTCEIHEQSLKRGENSTFIYGPLSFSLHSVSMSF